MTEKVNAAAAGERRQAGRCTAVGALLVAGLLLFPATDAAAVSNPVSGGETSLDLANRFKKRLKRKDAKMKPISPTRRAPGGFDLSVENGSLNPASGAATFRHGGGFRITAEGHRIRLRNPEVRMGSQLRMDVTIGARNRTLKFLRLSGGSSSPAGFGADIRDVQAIVTGKGAKRVNKSLDEKVLRRGQVLGVLTTVPTLKRVAVGGGQVTLAVAPAFQARLNVGPQPVFGPMAAAPIAPAAVIAPSPPTFTFPISNGSVAPDLSSGEIASTGGIRLSRPPHPAITPPPPPESPASYPTRNQAEVTDLHFALQSAGVDGTATLRPLTQPPVTIRTNVASIDLSGAGSSIDVATRTVTISNVVVSLGAVAGQLNQLFSNPLLYPGAQPTQFTPGDQIGTATLTTTVK